MTELNLEDIDLVLKTNLIKQQALELTDQEIEIFEGPNWKNFLSMICHKFLEKYVNMNYEECCICFFPYELEDFNKMMAEQNTTLMGTNMVKPLLCVRFDKDKNIKHMSKDSSKIPKDVILAIFCG